MASLNTKLPKWNKEEIISEIEKFSKIYNERPIKDNRYGMKFPHLFAFYFILKKLNPEYVVESGVYKGQGTWLIEKILPNAKILSIDIKLHYREFIASRAEYSNKDFKFQNFENIDLEKSLVIFDDHHNSLERLKECKWFGFKHIIFEDNYLPNEGDFYSLKQCLNGSGFKLKKNFFLEKFKGILIFLKFQIDSLFNKNYPFIDYHRFRLDHVEPNTTDYKYLKRNIETYYEFPPVFEPDFFTEENAAKKGFELTEPILKGEEKEKYQTAYNERNSYNWLTYIKLYS